MDPRRIFYVGKGVGDRCYSHAAGAVEQKPNATTSKIDLIREIQTSAGCDPAIEIVIHGLNESEALRIEAQMIKLLPGLTNIASGHCHEDYWLTTDEVNSRYAEPVRRHEIDGTILFVSLNRTYPEIADNAELLQRHSLGDWPISSERASRVDHIVAVYRQLARFAFTVDKSSTPTFDTEYPEGGKIRQRWRPSAVWRNNDLEKRIALKTVVDDTGEVLTRFSPRSSLRFSD
ncbi:hypothetical protein E5163_09060 [Marinicauda algicola]|uniref:GIY-YIG domain-containing protein n=1 Tax=Marinicauda algicola TaxID=2029849 RepID=A0A4S2H126_9PROT|nr:hypothetical protein [Marinicauda algicola]TGY89257.1 hypothetical protein E5163_09060 [Marinicauda algicola]